MKHQLSEVNDILKKFVNTEVYDVRDNKNKYISEKHQFKNYINNKLPENKIIQKKLKKNTELISKIIVADSRDRNKTVYPNPNRFGVKVCRFECSDEDATLERNIKNIKHIKLEECIVPDFTDFEPYLVMRIPELQNEINGTNNNLQDSFALLIPDKIFYHGDNLETKWITCKTSPSYCKKIFHPPLAKLPQMTVEYYSPRINENTNQYDLFDFSQKFPVIEEGPNPPRQHDIKNETLSVFSVCCECPNKNIFDYDIIV